MTTIVMLVGVVGCGGKASSSNSAPDAGAEAGGGAGRVPKEHRASALACPAERGAVSLTPNGCGASSTTDCVQDSDCKQGKNGRCIEFGSSCATSCSYDDCTQDSDCAKDTPCVCRTSATDSSANTCPTQGNCRVDADCGPKGYCSPSLVGDSCTCQIASACDGPCEDGCMHGYFCHVSQDTCIDDSDCRDGLLCAFDTIGNHFECRACAPNL
ncbi:MAG: hypothetical protein ABJB12_11810 [Pseudomonadota bacterium]